MSRLFARNVTGFVPHARAFTFNLSDPSLWSNTSSKVLTSYISTLSLANPVFHPLPVPIYNSTALSLESTADPSKAFSASPSPLSSPNAIVPRQHRPASQNSTSVVVPPLSGPPYYRNQTNARTLLSSFSWLPRLEDVSVVQPLAFGLTFREGWWGVKHNPARPGQSGNMTWSAVKVSLDVCCPSKKSGLRSSSTKS